MILSVINPLNKEIGRMHELNIEDFRSISFIIENGSDFELEEFFNSKFIGEFNAMTKLLLLIKARMVFVSEQITLNNGTSNVTIDINYMLSELLKQIQSPDTILKSEGLDITVSYPNKLLHLDTDELFIDCIKKLTILDKELNFSELDQEEKATIISKFNAKHVLNVLNYIEENSIDYTIFKARAGLDSITVNLFNNSVFAFIKALFSYYSYDDITELLFMLSKRVTDLSYLNSRTPRDLELFIRLYSEEIEKANTDTKSSQ